MNLSARGHGLDISNGRFAADRADESLQQHGALWQWGRLRVVLSGHDRGGHNQRGKGRANEVHGLRGIIGPYDDPNA